MRCVWVVDNTRNYIRVRYACVPASASTVAGPVAQGCALARCLAVIDEVCVRVFGCFVWQVPQYILEDAIAGGAGAACNIIVTQVCACARVRVRFPGPLWSDCSSIRHP